MALQRGGVAVDDPLAWWDSLPDDVVEFWRAYWQVEPWGCEWERHSYLMSLLDVHYAATINPHLDKRHRVKPRAPQDFMPVDFFRERQARPHDIIAQLDKYAGVKR